jgi:hypothetical protein
MHISTMSAVEKSFLMPEKPVAALSTRIRPFMN